MSGCPILNPTFFNPGLYRNILKLWFNDLPYPASTPPYPVLARWFGFNSPPEARAAFDAQCRSAAKDALLSIKPEQFALPQLTKPPSEPSKSSKIAEPFLAQLFLSDDPAPEQTALALVLLLDQFPRNCFRDNQKDIYTHYDRISRGLLQDLLVRGLDSHERYRDSPPWRLWFYMPLMHSEDLRDHETFEAKMLEMRNLMQQKGDEDAIRYLDMTTDFEKRHKAILDRFGRYPHRNEVLGRQSTVEETEYLENGGETFGS